MSFYCFPDFMSLFRQKSSLTYHLKKNPSHNKSKIKRRRKRAKAEHSATATQNMDNKDILKETDGQIKTEESQEIEQNMVQHSEDNERFKCTVCSKLLSSYKSLSVRF